MDTESYFAVQHSAPVNVTPVTMDNPPDEADLANEMPLPFKMASEAALIDASAVRFLHHLGDNAKDLVEYLQLQSKKIDMLLSYILAQQDEPTHRFHTEKLGAGGICYFAKTALPVDSLAQVKIFLSEESAAVYCYGRVTRCEQTTKGQLIEMQFASIREQDRELLVRASLHIQSKQLKLRAEQRSKQNG